MILQQGTRTKTIHDPGCDVSGEVQNWAYAQHLQTLDALSRHTVAFPRIHVCGNCLPGVCQCKKCGRKT